MYIINKNKTKAPLLRLGLTMQSRMASDFQPQPPECWVRGVGYHAGFRLKTFSLCRLGWPQTHCCSPMWSWICNSLGLASSAEMYVYYFARLNPCLFLNIFFDWVLKGFHWEANLGHVDQANLKLKIHMPISPVLVSMLEAWAAVSSLTRSMKYEWLCVVTHARNPSPWGWLNSSQ